MSDLENINSSFNDRINSIELKEELRWIQKCSDTVTYLDVFLIPIWKISHISVVDFLAHQAGADALLGVWTGGLLSNLTVKRAARGLLLPYILYLGLVSFINRVVFILSL